MVNLVHLKLIYMKILIPTSPGGHLKQSLILAKKLNKRNAIVFATYYTPVARKLLSGFRSRFVTEPGLGLTSLPRKIMLAFQALLMMIKENPDVIITTGSDVPVSFCYIGKLMGKKIIFIESWSRVKTPSKSGKLIYHIADLFFVQWRDLKSSYPKAVYAGRFV